MKETIDKINTTKSWFFENTKNIDKPLDRLIKKEKKTKINGIRNEKGKVTTDTAKITKDHERLLQASICNKMDNLEEKDKSLEKHNLTRLNQEEIKNLNITDP